MSTGESLTDSMCVDLGVWCDVQGMYRVAGFVGSFGSRRDALLKAFELRHSDLRTRLDGERKRARVQLEHLKAMIDNVLPSIIDEEQASGLGPGQSLTGHANDLATTIGRIEMLRLLITTTKRRIDGKERF